MNHARTLGQEFSIRHDGKIARRANHVLEQAVTMLEEVAAIGLFAALERGMFADIKRSRDGGKGLAGVAAKDREYQNPFMDVMMKDNLARQGGKPHGR